jgi:WD40 repeat protein
VACFPGAVDSVAAIDIAPNGNLLAIADAKGSIKLYELPGFQELRSIGDHDAAVYSVAFSPDSKRLATVSRDVTSRVWDVSSGEEISRIKLANPGVAAVAFSNAGDQVATCTWRSTGSGESFKVQGIVWIWDATTGTVKYEQTIGVKPLDSIAWSPDDSTLIVGSWDGLVHVLDNEANEKRMLNMPDEQVYNAVVSVAIRPDGKYVAAGSKDRTARIWNIAEGTLISTMRGHDGFVNEVKFSDNGKELVTASVDGTIRTWDVETGEPQHVLLGHTGSVTTFDYSDERIVSAGRDQSIRFWNPGAMFGGGPKVHLKTSAYTTIFSPEGRKLYVASFEGFINVVDPMTGDLIDSWKAHQESCNTLSISRDGSRLLSCSWDNTAILWNPADHSVLQTFDAKAGVVHCSLSPDGKYAALGVGKTIQVWNADTGKLLGACEGHEAQIVEVVYSADGSSLASSAGSDPVRIWNTESRQCLATLGQESNSSRSVAFSPDGARIATGGTGSVALWNAADFKLQSQTDVGDRNISRLAFSPDGRRLAAGSDAISILEVTLGTVLLRFAANDDDVYYLAFSPDGNQLASCTTSGQISFSETRSLRSRRANRIAGKTGQPNDNPDSMPVNELALSVPDGTPDGKPDWSIDNASVVIEAKRGESLNLFVLNRKTDQLTPVTKFEDKTHGANAVRVSPDGKQIAFQFVRPKNYDIHVMSTSGGKSTELVVDPNYDVLPVWSPSGKQIAFMSTRGFELGSIGPFPGHIYIMDADGKHLRQVTEEPLTSSLGPSDWSPDGRTLLLARKTDKAIDVFSLDMATSKETRLTSDEASEYSATYSHDGKKIAFHAESDRGSEIVICDQNGKNRITLTSGGFNYNPKWSPDDQWLIYTTSSAGDQNDILAVRIEDKKTITILATEEDERGADWLR